MMFGRHPMFGPMRSQGFMNMPFYNQPFSPRPGLGGFLTRLFSRGQAASPNFFSMGMPPIQNAANSLNTGGGIVNMLGNVQKALGVVQQVTPMVRQYGPLIKNIPSMIKLFKELEPADETSSHTKQENETETKKERDLPTTSNKKKESESIKEPKGISKPKLYI
jgi:YqfQ-like protein